MNGLVEISHLGRSDIIVHVNSWVTKILSIILKRNPLARRNNSNFLKCMILIVKPGRASIQTGLFFNYTYLFLYAF